jgi:hypothetical protein
MQFWTVGVTSPYHSEPSFGIHFPKNPKLQPDTTTQANIRAVSTHSFKRRRPSGKSLLYSRKSRKDLVRYHPSWSNCFSFGGRSLTLSTISRCVRVEMIPTTATQASATARSISRGTIYGDSSPLRRRIDGLLLINPVYTHHDAQFCSV